MYSNWALSGVWARVERLSLGRERKRGPCMFICPLGDAPWTLLVQRMEIERALEEQVRGENSLEEGQRKGHDKTGESSTVHDVATERNGARPVRVTRITHNRSTSTCTAAASQMGAMQFEPSLPRFLQPSQSPLSTQAPCPVPVHATYSHERPFGQAQVLWWPWKSQNGSVVPRTVLLFIPGPCALLSPFLARPCFLSIDMRPLLVQATQGCSTSTFPFWTRSTTRPTLPRRHPSPSFPTRTWACPPTSAATARSPMPLP